MVTINVYNSNFKKLDLIKLLLLDRITSRDANDILNNRDELDYIVNEVLKFKKMRGEVILDLKTLNNYLRYNGLLKNNYENKRIQWIKQAKNFKTVKIDRISKMKHITIKIFLHRF